MSPFVEFLLREGANHVVVDRRSGQIGSLPLDLSLGGLPPASMTLSRIAGNRSGKRFSQHPCLLVEWLDLKIY